MALISFSALEILVGLRTLFHYARWIFPTAKYRSEKSSSLGHKAILGALALGLVGAVLYDVLRAMFLGLGV